MRERETEGGTDERMTIEGGGSGLIWTGAKERKSIEQLGMNKGWVWRRTVERVLRAIALAM